MSLQTGKKVQIKQEQESPGNVASCEKNKYLPFKRVNGILVGESNSNEYINLGDLILSSLNFNPNFIGQIDAETGETVTFQQMRERSIKLALWLKKKGVTRKDVVTICTNNQIQAYLPFLACIYLNLIVNPWDSEYIKDTIRTLFFLEEYNPDVIFIDDENFENLQVALTSARRCGMSIPMPRIIIFEKKTERECDFLDSILNSDFKQSKIEKFMCKQHIETYNAVVMYSSNTINYPGLANISYGAFLAPSNNETPVMRFNDVGLWYESFGWSYSLLLTVRAILFSVTAIKASRFNEKNLCKIIEKYKVSWVFLKSSMCNKISNTNIFRNYNVSSLKTMLFADTSIRREIHEGLIEALPNTSIIQVYGHSETGVIAYQRNADKIGSSGYVSKNVQLMFVDLKTRQLVGPNRHGEIWCKTPIIRVASDATKSLESKYDLKRTNQGWYYTGDVGYFDEDGDIFVLGKSREMIRYKNVYISPTEIEEVLQDHPAVSEVVVAGVKVNNPDGQYPKAFIKKRPGAKVTKKELMQFVEFNLDDNYLLRGGVCFIKGKMPYLPNGYIDRLKIQAMSCEPDD